VATDRVTPVLFVCVHNAGRSQMAAGFLTHLAGDRVEVRSADGSMTRRSSGSLGMTGWPWSRAHTATDASMTPAAAQRADPQGAAPVERDDSHDGRSQQARDPCLAGATA